VNASSERSRSLWGKSAIANAPPLAADATADVAVVGAGIAGLSVAYELARSGRSVIVLDRGPIGGGMTARTTGHLASALDDYYHALIEADGIDAARQVCAAQVAAVDRIEAIVREERIDCDFTRLDGYLFLGPDTDPAVLEKEHAAAREVGLAVDWADEAPIPGIRSGRCLRFPNQGRFHPLKYLNGLIGCLARAGVRLHGGTTVNDVAEEKDGTVLVRSEGGATARVKACAVTTNSPFNEVDIHYKQAPYRTYAIAARVSRGSVADALFWDTLDPYHYVRLQPGEDGADWLISGGEDHKSGEADDMEARLARLESWTRRLFPSFGDVEHRWSGQVLEPVDYAAFIGRSTTGRNIYMATGDSGQSLTNAVAASLILGGLIQGREVPYAPAHDPQRAVRGAVKEFIVENAEAVAKLAAKLTPG
jgi:glycine/D-amino acid oxidase-like deaminating enzyme